MLHLDEPTLVVLASSHALLLSGAMAAVCLAIIGKDEKPLYIKEFFDEDNPREDCLFTEEELFGLPSASTPSSTQWIDCSLKQQFILHSSLDKFQQIEGPPPGYGWRSAGVSGTDAMFVGLLQSVEDMRVYAYMTTTHIKFLLVVQDRSSMMDETIKRLFLKIHRIYVEYMLNPFCQINAPISSVHFDTKLKDLVTAYNRTLY